jgi:hypothetical protein
MSDPLLERLRDRKVLLQGYAADSAYVLHRAFESTPELNELRKRGDLAPSILARLRRLAEKPQDPVILGAHLYALELTGSRPALREGVRLLLDKPILRRDPLVGQLAGQAGARLLRPTMKPKLEPTFDPGELEVISANLKEVQP